MAVEKPQTHAIDLVGPHPALSRRERENRSPNELTQSARTPCPDNRRVLSRPTDSTMAGGEEIHALTGTGNVS
jgi:hypothetical protein